METKTTDPARTRKEILVTARILFQQQGFDQTSIKDITDRLQLNEETLAAYFTSKDDLLEAIWAE